MSKIELSIRTATLILTIIAPFACIATYGWEYSYSQYWNTPLQPLFILSNIITAYYLFDSERWKIPALWPYLVCIVIVFYDLLLAEILAMGCLVLFHGLMLYKYKRLNKQKQINNEQNER